MIGGIASAIVAEGGAVVYANVSWYDVGVGLRMGLPGSGILRFDFGRGLTDGKNAVFIGLNQVF